MRIESAGAELAEFTTNVRFKDEMVYMYVSEYIGHSIYVHQIELLPMGASTAWHVRITCKVVGPIAILNTFTLLQYQRTENKK